MTSRELTDAFDHLICLRILAGDHLCSTADLNELNEKIEVTKRAIADALLDRDPRPGVAVVTGSHCQVCSVGFIGEDGSCQQCNNRLLP